MRDELVAVPGNVAARIQTPHEHVPILGDRRARVTTGDDAFDLNVFVLKRDARRLTHSTRGTADALLAHLGESVFDLIYPFASPTAIANDVSFRSFAHDAVRS